jgi:hypothetical protein
MKDPAVRHPDVGICGRSSLNNPEIRAPHRRPVMDPAETAFEFWRENAAKGIT